jgi:hypothetical protein
MANPREFLESWVRERVQAIRYRNKVEARRLAYECKKATESADLSRFAVVMAAGGDLQGCILTELDHAAEQGN